MNISAAASAAGLPIKTVRYYADIGLVEPSGRTEAGYRVYDATTVAKLGFVRRARAFDFSIEECRDLLGLYEDKTRSSADVKAIARKHLDDIRARQQELQVLHDELAHLVESCAGDHRPDCPIIDALG